MRSSKSWKIIQAHPEFSDYEGSDKDLRDQRGQNPIVINLKKGQWYDESRGEGGELSLLAERLEYPPEQLSIDENARPEPMSISQADTGLPERQRKQSKEWLLPSTFLSGLFCCRRSLLKSYQEMPQVLFQM